ncbi:F0F1 ATP synthase subunit epsilon [Roseovarius salinarum]|uniref:F0F1 ATP synthase subunit epsilon n=1 Tax=Roseovarius salinarum TaxID=1981892 RepID=UPI0012FFED4C|nr:F0F1 ATP synthase subunit epsilon [Roseovarius salinarum]
MRLELVTPREIRVDRPVTRIVAEGTEGTFCLLPRHVDYVARLVPGIVVYDCADGPTLYAGTTSGTLVKQGDEVLVSTRHAVLGDDLEHVQRRVAETFHALEESERAERATLARLEAEFIRRLQGLDEATP